MDFVPVVSMAFLVFTIINFIRFVFGRDINGVVTTLSVWVAGVVVIFLVAQTDFAHDITIAETSLSTLNTASLLFVGLTISSVATFSNEVLKAVDRTQSQSKPHLID